jgi:hypothetical protein
VILKVVTMWSTVFCIVMLYISETACSVCCLLLSWLICQAWKWRQYVPLKCRALSKLHDATTRTVLFFLRVIRWVQNVAHTAYVDSDDKIILQEVLGRTNRLLSLIRHGPHWKRRVQQFFHCRMCIRYCGNVSTEPLPRNDRGISTEPLPRNDSAVYTDSNVI